MHRFIKIIFLVVWLDLMLAARTFAGPPFLTDDPVPTDYQHWEAYLFTLGDYAGHDYTINGPALELDYGALPDTQLSLSVPMTSVGGDTPSAAGLGDIEVGVKYRFLHETNGWPQIAFAPAITLPTGDSARGLGNGRAAYQLPLWAGKSFGPWTTYGGGGAALNSAPGQRDYPFGGWLLQRDFGSSLTLGGEIYAQAQNTGNDQGSVALNFGGQYNFNEHFSLLASAGHSVAGDNHTLWYFGLYWTW